MRTWKDTCGDFITLAWLFFAGWQWLVALLVIMLPVALIASLVTRDFQLTADERPIESAKGLMLSILLLLVIGSPSEYELSGCRIGVWHDS